MEAVLTIIRQRVLCAIWVRALVEGDDETRDATSWVLGVFDRVTDGVL